MLILRTTDRIPCKVGDVKVWVSPLSWEEKNNAFSQGKENPSGMAFETLRNAIKRVELPSEAKFSNGSKAEVEYGEDGKLTHESLEFVIQIGAIAPFTLLSAAMLTKGLSEEIDGVEVDFGNIEDTKKKN
jgi:hypothetical protein